jgi:hypothetical protein
VIVSVYCPFAEDGIGLAAAARATKEALEDGTVDER